MGIKAIYGFSSYQNFNGQGLTNFTGLGKIPFHANHINGGNSNFKWENAFGRVWLRSDPRNVSRRPVTACRCRFSTSCCCRDWERYENTNSTNTNRRRDSSLRTPCFNFPVRDCFLDDLDDETIRYFTMGFRLWLPTGDFGHNTLVGLHTSGGNITGTGWLAMSSNEIGSGDLDENNCVYIEIVFDLKKGIVRRWLGERELNRRVMTQTLINGFADHHFQFGVKSSSISGGRQAVNRGSYGSCPAPTSYPYDTGAPNDLEYGLTDIYFLTTPAERDGDRIPFRLGEVEVESFDVSDFFINRFWENPSEDPTITVNRLKTTNSASAGPSVVGDTHADPATVLFNQQDIVLEDEVVYLEVDVYGHRGANGARKMVVKSIGKDNTPLGERELDLPTNQLSIEENTRRAFSKEMKLGEEDLGTLLGDLQLRITFKE